MSLRLASLIQGSGTTMAAITQAAKEGEIPYEVVCVIARREGIGGIGKAIDLGVAKDDVVVIDPDNYKDSDGKIDQEKFGEALNSELTKREVDVVMQNGWLPNTPLSVIEKFKGKIFNQHCGPVPEFGGKGMYGIRVHAAVLEFRKMTGHPGWTEMIVQRVEPNFDEGEVLKSQKVELLDSDTPESLQARCLPIEHRVNVDFLKDFASGNIHVARHESIILPGEEEILDEVKRKAVEMYSKS